MYVCIYTHLFKIGINAMISPQVYTIVVQFLVSKGTFALSISILILIYLVLVRRLILVQDWYCLRSYSLGTVLLSLKPDTFITYLLGVEQIM